MNKNIDIFLIRDSNLVNDPEFDTKKKKKVLQALIYWLVGLFKILALHVTLPVFLSRRKYTTNTTRKMKKFDKKLPPLRGLRNIRGYSTVKVPLIVKWLTS